MTAFWIVLAMCGLPLLWGVLSYNRFVSQRHLIANSWSNVDTELHRRHDLIPNLVRTVQGYTSHESDTLTRVVAARQGAIDASDTSSQSDAEGELVAGLRQLLAVSEAYPDLQASHSFLDLQRELVTTEDRIQAARRLFNGNVRDYNRRVESFPAMVIARLARFERESYFEVEPAVRVAGAPSVAH